MTLVRPLFLSALALASLTAAVPAMAETLVLKASGPSARDYPPGRKLADSGQLVLKTGDSIMLLDARGTRTVRGPGTFSAGAGAGTDTSPATTRIASLLTTTRMRRARTGAVRGNGEDGKPARSPNLWYVDTTRSGGTCVRDPAAVRLWRPDISQPATMTASATKGGASATISFAQGDLTAAWPMAALPIADGATYRLSGGALKAPIDIRFSLIALSDQNAATVASTLLAHDCTAQLDLLAETTAVAETPTG